MRKKHKEILKIEWGITIFEGKKKVKQLRFKSEKDMVYALYKLEQDLGKTI